MKKILSLVIPTVLAIHLDLALPNPALAYQTNMSASVVIGQPNFTSSSSGTGPTSLANPFGVATDCNKLFISDDSNNRVLIYDKIPTSNATAADVVIGQTNFSNNSSNQGGSAAANTLSFPSQIETDGNRLFVSDNSNARVLIYNKIPTSNNASADMVIGEPNFTTISGGTTQTLMADPNGLDYDPQTGKLAIADSRRVLIYNRVPTTNGAPADVVVGKTSFTDTTPGTSATIFGSVNSTRFANGGLLVADRTNNRVLFYKSVPTSNGAAADVVIGQPDFTSSSANQGGDAAANTLSSPRDVLYDGKRLFIADNGNTRVLIFNGIPDSNNASADLVLGQSNFTNTTQAVTASNFMDTNAFLAHCGNSLFVGDFTANRVLIFNNVIQNPQLTLTGTITAGNSNKLRISGRATVDSLYAVSKIEYSINGGVWHATTATDDSFNSGTENFYFDFDQTENGNSLEGFTVRIKAQNTNLDDVDRVFFFDPFVINSPKNDKVTAATLPTFDFSVNKQRINMRDNLEKYQIQIAKSGTEDWKTYIDNIPPDFQTVKNLPDNQRRSFYENAATNNGVYETSLLTATYSEESSRISVIPKDVASHQFPFGKKLETGQTYRWKVVAIDKSGKTQETPTYNLKVENPASPTQTQVQGIQTEEPEVDATGHPLPSPAPSPSPLRPRSGSAASQEENPPTGGKFCIWFLCWPF